MLPTSPSWAVHASTLLTQTASPVSSPLPCRVYNKLPPNSDGLQQQHLLSHSFCGSATQEWLHGVLWLPVSHEASVQGSAGPAFVRKPAWGRICFQARSHGRWQDPSLVARGASPRGLPCKTAHKVAAGFLRADSDKSPRETTRKGEGGLL